MAYPGMYASGSYGGKEDVQHCVRVDVLCRLKELFVDKRWKKN